MPPTCCSLGGLARPPMASRTWPRALIAATTGACPRLTAFGLAASLSPSAESPSIGEMGGGGLSPHTPGGSTGTAREARPPPSAWPTSKHSRVITTCGHAAMLYASSAQEASSVYRMPRGGCSTWVHIARFERSPG